MVLKLIIIHDENTKEITYPVLMCIAFGHFIPSFSPHFMVSLRSYIKRLKQCFIGYSNTSRCLDI